MLQEIKSGRGKGYGVLLWKQCGVVLPPASALQFKTFEADRNAGWILATNSRMDTDIFVFIRAFEADKKGFILQEIFTGTESRENIRHMKS